MTLAPTDHVEYKGRKIPAKIIEQHGGDWHETYLYLDKQGRFYALSVRQERSLEEFFEAHPGQEFTFPRDSALYHKFSKETVTCNKLTPSKAMDLYVREVMNPTPLKTLMRAAIKSWSAANKR